MKRFILALSLLAGCSVSNIATTRDDFDLRTRYEMQNTLPFGMFSFTRIFLNPVHIRYDSGRALYALRVVYIAPGWLFLAEGESLVFLIDGQRVGLRADDRPNERDVFLGGSTADEGYYAISHELLKQLGNAKSVRVKLVGQNSFVESELSKDNIDNFRAFAARFAPNNTIR